MKKDYTKLRKIRISLKQRIAETKNICKRNSDNKEIVNFGIIVLKKLEEEYGKYRHFFPASGE